MKLPGVSLRRLRPFSKGLLLDLFSYLGVDRHLIHSSRHPVSSPALEISCKQSLFIQPPVGLQESGSGCGSATLSQKNKVTTDL